MMRKLLLALAVVGLLFAGGCADVGTADHEGAHDDVKDESLDYQDYQESGCPYLDDSLDYETMEKCDEWIEENK